MPGPNTPASPAWRGFLIMVALLMIAIVTFNLEMIVGLTRRHIDVVVLVKDAPGVRIGTDVWVEGVHAGRVRAVEITNHDGAAHVALDVRMERRTREVVTASSDVRAARRRLIGEPVVRIYAGSPGDRPVQPGDTLVGRPRIQPEDLLAISETLPATVDSLLATAELIRAAVERRVPQVELLSTELARTRATAQAVSDAIEAGSLGRMLDPATGLAARMAALRTRVHDLNVAATDLIERYASETDDGLGPGLDSLAQRIRQVDAAAVRLQERIDEGEGIVARARQDTALQLAVRGVQLQVDSLRAEAHSIMLRMFLPQAR